MDQADRDAALSPEAAAAAPSGAELRTQLAALADWYASLDPVSLEDIDRFYTASACFKDPFNTVRSRDGIAAVFRHMFKTLDEPVFIIHDQLLDGTQAFMTWDFRFRRGAKVWHLHGGSHLHLDRSGKVTCHRDYWDSAEELLHKLPLVGPPLRLLRRMLSVRDEGWHQ